MVSSISVTNFRAFSDVKIDDCRLINVIVGDNGSGKTALLEGIFLAAGVTPELILRTFDWRGYARGQFQGTSEDLHEALWSDLFFKFNTRHGAVISLKGTKEQTRSVTVRVNAVDKKIVIPEDHKRPRGGVRVAPEPSPIEFRWNIQGAPDVVIKPIFDNNTLTFPGSLDRHYVKASFFASNQPGSGYEVVNRFSTLSRNFRADVFVEKFGQLFANIEDLSVEMSAGTPMLFAKVANIPRMIPLSLASGGMSRTAGILLAIATQSNGMVIIDEAENGIHYKRMDATWEAIVDAAQFYNTQIFVSTHSQECLQSLAPLIERYPSLFGFVRTVSRPTGSILRQFEGNQIAQAIMDDVEVR